MKELIEVLNLSIKYDDKQLFNNLNIKIEENTFLSILGPNKSGKSHLASIISLEKPNDFIKIKGRKITKIMKETLKQEILYITSTPNNILKEKTVKQYMNELFENNDEIKKPIQNLLKLKEIENKTFEQMSLGEKNRLQFLQYFLKQPIIVVLDNAFSNMTTKYKKPILEYLKKECLNKNTTVIMIPTDIEDIIYSDKTAFIINKQLITFPTNEVYEQEALFKEVSLNRPFMVELSSKLKYYDLINETYLDEEKLVQKLWKST